MTTKCCSPSQSFNKEREKQVCNGGSVANGYSRLRPVLPRPLFVNFLTLLFRYVESGPPRGPRDTRPAGFYVCGVA